MNSRLTRSALTALALGLVVAGCQEQLTAPGSCPATCPGGTPVLRDTVIEALIGQDSVHTGFAVPGATDAGLRVSNGLLGNTDYGVIKFSARPDSILLRDTARTYTVDSVAIIVGLLARDTTASGIRLALHRLPATVDTSAQFGDIDPLIVDGTLIDSVTIADSVRVTDSATSRTSFLYRFVFQGDTLAQVDIPAADSGVFAMAVAISGPTATGVRVGGIGGGTAVPLIRAYVTLNVTDTTPTVKHQVLQSRPTFTRWVTSEVAPAPDSTVLAIGSPTGSRAYLRFPWPAYLRDSALLVRATLELVPETPFQGLPGEKPAIIAEGVRVDFGVKSPVVERAASEGVAFTPIGMSDTVRVELVRELKTWQADRLAHPPMLVVRSNLAGASFTEPRFYSTLSPVVARHPRIRITYQLPFDFERP